MNVTVLIENTSKNELLCEHGVSLLITYQKKNILLDAGRTDAFYENAKKLGIPLDKTNICVLSHGHNDHSGGLSAIFQNHKDIKVYAQSGAAERFFSGSGGKLHEISMPQEVRLQSDRFSFIDGYREIYPGVSLIPHNTKNLDKAGALAKLYKLKDETLVPDDFLHEQSLVFDTEKGLIIFNSCSHGGFQNIIREAKEFHKNKAVYAYIGGLHMKGKKNGEEICAISDDEMDTLCNAIREEKIAHIYTGHCTGRPGYEKLQKRLGSTVHALTTGMRFRI